MQAARNDLMLAISQPACVNTHRMYRRAACLCLVHSRTSSLSTHADRRLLYVCYLVCTVTDFSAEDKANGVKFCTAAHRPQKQGISHFCELCSPEAHNRTNRPARGPRPQHVNITVEMRRRKRHARDAPFVK